MSLAEQLKQDAENLGQRKGGNFFKIEDGETKKFRVLTTPVALGQHFLGQGQRPHTCYGIKEGCPLHGQEDEKGEEKYKLSVKYVAYVLDRTDSRVKIAELPYTIIKKMAFYETDEDYNYNGYPMPYDLKVKFDKKAAPSEKYSIDAVPQRSEVGEEVMGTLAEEMAFTTPEEFVEKKKQYQVEEDKKNGIWLSPEVIAKREEERKAKFRADAVAYAKEHANDLPVIEYPEGPTKTAFDDENPADINLDEPLM